MNVTLHPNAIFYFMLRHAFKLAVLGLFILVFVSRHTVHGTVNGQPAQWDVTTGLRWALLIIYLILLGIVWFYNRTLVQSYRIELRNEGVGLHYGVFNLNNEVLLFTKIQDIVINRNIVERMMGLSTMIVQNAMGQPERIPGLGADVADKLREDILGHINRKAA